MKKKQIIEDAAKKVPVVVFENKGEKVIVTCHSLRSVEWSIASKKHKVVDSFLINDEGKIIIDSGISSNLKQALADIVVNIEGIEDLDHKQNRVLFTDPSYGNIVSRVLNGLKNENQGHLNTSHSFIQQSVDDLKFQPFTLAKPH